MERQAIGGPHPIRAVERGGFVAHPALVHEPGDRKGDRTEGRQHDQARLLTDPGAVRDAQDGAESPAPRLGDEERRGAGRRNDHRDEVGKTHLRRVARCGRASRCPRAGAPRRGSGRARIAPPITTPASALAQREGPPGGGAVGREGRRLVEDQPADQLDEAVDPGQQSDEPEERGYVQVRSGQECRRALDRTAPPSHGCG